MMLKVKTRSLSAQPALPSTAGMVYERFIAWGAGREARCEKFVHTSATPVEKFTFGLFHGPLRFNYGPSSH